MSNLKHTCSSHFQEVKIYTILICRIAENQRSKNCLHLRVSANFKIFLGHDIKVLFFGKESSKISMKQF